MRTIIAEFCQNHKGDLGLLKEMVWAAAEAGATYAKIQSILADELTYRERFEEGQRDGERQLVIRRPYQPEYERLKPMDLSDEAHVWFGEECRQAGIKPLTTVFTRSRLAFVASLGWDAVKIASYDCASHPFIRELKGRFEHLYISTGATYDEEIEETARLLAGQPFTFLHAVTIYPTPLDELHLARLDYLRQFSPSVGFSDHSLVARDGITASVAAMMAGADVVERHFTILPVAETKDGPVSIRPNELKQLVDFSKQSQAELQAYITETVPDYQKMYGESRRPLSHAEELNRDYYRGRFASKVNGQVIYNWEDKPVHG